MFKKPWCNNQHQSYYIPPKTSILGLISGILGIEKKKYLKEIPFNSIKIGIEILRRSKKELVGFNFMHGKKIGKITKKISNPFRDPTSKGSTSPTRVEYLKGVSYRIYIQLEDDNKLSELYNLLSKNKFHYPPFLGQVNLFAKISKVTKLELNNDQRIETISTVSPTDIVEIKKLESGLYQVEKMPYKFSEDRELPEYISILYYVEPGKEIILKNIDYSLNSKYLIGKININGNKKGAVLY